jgi:hypothetical protein
MFIYLVPFLLFWYTTNIIDPFISVPVPTASHDHHDGPAKRNHIFPFRLAVIVKVKFCEGYPKVVENVDELDCASAESAGAPGAELFVGAGPSLALGKMSSGDDNRGHNENAEVVSVERVRPPG